MNAVSISPETRPPSRYRPEIAGLRALAVVCVVLCHLKIAYFDGGFVGVDIFFVISGFLISKHITAEIRNGEFRFSEFYLRRARRILPALLFTTFASFFAGLLWLDPLSFRALAKETTHALLSISNIQYWRESKEYFAQAAEHLPLLHIWSLSLEEQFYLFWPAFLLIASRYVRLWKAVIAIGALSLGGCVLVMQHDPQAAFFLMPLRIFEFAVGALCAVGESRLSLGKKHLEAASLAGICAIVASVVFFTPGTPLPGLASLLPCIGTAFVIHAGSRQLAARILSSPAAQYVGAISYSLYLCHWPILFFARYIFGPDAETLSAKSIMLIVMVLVAIGMERFVERPFRTPPNSLPRQSIQRYVGLIASFALVSHLAFAQDGWAWRLTPRQQRLAELQSFGVRPCKGAPLERCDFGSSQGTQSLELMGDSFAHQYVAGLDPLLKPMGLRGAVTIVGGCPMLIGLLLKDSGVEFCQKAHSDVFSRLSQNTTRVVLAQAWAMYSDERTMSDNDMTRPSSTGFVALEAALRRTLDFLAKNGRRVLIIGSQVYPTCPIDKASMSRGPLWRNPPPPCPPQLKAHALQSGQVINDMLQRVRIDYPSNVSLLLPANRLCGDLTCPVVLDDAWLYIDQGHFSVAGSIFMVERSEPDFRALLAP